MYNFNLNDFFAAFKSLRAGGTQSSMNFQGVQRGCCQGQSFMPSQAFDYPDADVRFDMGCGCAQPMQPIQPMQVPDRGCGCNKPSEQFKTDFNVNSGIIDGPGNDIYDAPGKDVYAFGNRGIIDTDGNDMYVKNFTVNNFNTVNNFYRQEIAEPTVEPEPTTPSVEPPGPSETPVAKPNLMPLRNLLTNIEKLQPDGVLSDSELNKAMSNPHYADLNGDSSSISSEELAIFNRIKALNTNKDLLSDVIKGDYSNISDSDMSELSSLSDAIKELTQRR